MKTSFSKQNVFADSNIFISFFFPCGYLIYFNMLISCYKNFTRNHLAYPFFNKYQRVKCSFIHCKTSHNHCLYSQHFFFIAEKVLIILPWIFLLSSKMCRTHFKACQNILLYF